MGEPEKKLCKYLLDFISEKELKEEFAVYIGKRVTEELESIK